MTTGEVGPTAAGGTTATEVALLALWRDVLEQPDLSVDDDFFVVGGDSLSGVTLLAQVTDVFGVEIPPLAMYDEASTVSTMAGVIDRIREGASPAA